MKIICQIWEKWRLIDTRVPFWVKILVRRIIWELLRRIIWELRKKYKPWKDYWVVFIQYHSRSKMSLVENNFLPMKEIPNENKEEQI